MAVRRERVILELQDDFTTKMAKAATATAVLDRELNHLSGDAVRSSRATRQLDDDTKKLGNTAGGSSREVDRLSGRLRIWADAAVLLTPAIDSLTSVGIAGFAGLTSEVGFAVVGAGAAILAFHGLGDTLQAVNKAALDPTEANLEAARRSMESLTPAARDFVRELRGLMPELQRLQAIAQANMFPGLAAGLHDLQGAVPEVERIVAAVSAELGKIGADAGKSLASDRWAPFLSFLETEAPNALGDLAKSVGNVTHALAELWMAFAPLNREFGDWLVSTTADLDRWAEGLGNTEGFQEFIRYVHETGPEVARTIGDMATAFLKVAEAGAPLAGPVLGALDAISKIVAAIAGSDLGTPIYAGIAALILYNRALTTTTKLQTAWNGGLGVAAGKIGLVTAAIAAFSVLDKALNLSMDQGSISRMTSVLDAKAGPNIEAQIQATKDAIKQQQQIADNANIHINLGITDIYSSDKAAKAADTVIGLKGHLKDLEAQQEVNEATNNSYTLSVQRQSAALVAQKQAAHDTAQSFLAFGSSLSDSKVSLGEWIHELEEQASALEHFGQNAKTAADRGLRQGLIKALEAAGAQGAMRMKQLANGTDAEITRANRAWARGRQAIRDYNAIVVPRKQIDIDTAAAQAKLNALILRINNLNANGGLHVRGPKPPTDRDNNPLTPYWVGGFTGQGGRYEPAGVVHRGEVVWSMEDVAAWGGPNVVDAMRQVRNGYATGGTPDPTPDSVLGALYGSGASGGSGSSGTTHHNTPATVGARHELARFESALKRSTKALDKEKAKRDELVQKRDELSSTVSGTFRSDLFAQPSPASVWMSTADRQKAGLGDVFSTLTGDIGNATAFRAALKSLKSKGVHGDALAAIASSGNLLDAQALASASASDIKRYETLFDRRQSVTASLGGFAGEAVYGAAIKAQTAVLGRIAAENKALTHEVAELRKQLKHATAPRRRT